MDVTDLIFMGLAGSVTALHKVDGSVAWRQKLTEHWYELPAAMVVTLCVEEGCVYAHAANRLYCLDALTGRIAWKTHTEPGFATLATRHTHDGEGALAGNTHATHSAAAAAGTS